MDRPISIVFFASNSGKEPVREWLKDLSVKQRRSIGEDIKTLQYGWPVGMPLARKLDTKLGELRSRVTGGIARTFFTIYQGQIVLLHGFIKKSQKTPDTDMSIAKTRLQKLRS